MPEKFNIISLFSRNFQRKFTPEEERLILSSFSKETFTRKERVFMNGDANTKHFFIESGLMRLFLIDKSGREFNILFAKENQVIGDLITPEPTNFNLEAIEKTTAYSISENNLSVLMSSLSLSQKTNPNSSIRKSYINIQKRLVSILTNTAEENYILFKERYPDLIQRLPQYHVASYLGITAEFLSKIIAKSTKK